MFVNVLLGDSNIRFAENKEGSRTGAAVAGAAVAGVSEGDAVAGGVGLTAATTGDTGTVCFGTAAASV